MHQRGRKWGFVFHAVVLFLGDPVETTKSVEEFIQSKNFNAENITATLKPLLDNLEKFDFADLPAPMLNWSSPDPKTNPESWIPEAQMHLRRAKLALHERMQEFYRLGKLREEDIPQIRRAMRIFRYADESFSYHLHVIIPQQKQKIIPARPNSNPLPPVYRPELILNPRFDSAAARENLKSILKPGDIFIAKGDASISAAISRLATDDSQFSHVALLSRDFDGRPVTVEAHIENDVRPYPLDEFLGKKRARFVVYRYPDAAIAQRAGDLAYAEVNRAIRKGKPIKYNFRANLSEVFDDELFCSMVARRYFRLASNDEVILPTFPSVFQMENPELLMMLRIHEAQKTYAPGDTEVDPLLDFVAEWRDPIVGYDANIADLTLTEMYDRMNQGYQMIPGTMAKVSRKVLLPLRKTPSLIWEHIPVIGKRMKEGFPSYIEPETLEAMVSLTVISDKIRAELKRKDQESVEKNGYVLSWKKRKEAVAEILKGDAENSREIFELFRPKQ